MSRVTKTTRGWGSPSRYYQGPNELENIRTYTEKFGNKVLAIIDPYFFEQMSGRFEKIYAGTDNSFLAIQYAVEVTEKRIQEITDQVKDFAPQVVLGIGGGKTIDTAKAVADNYRAAVIIVPTAVSTDAPTIALSVIYTEDGEHVGARHYAKNPDVVLVDSKIIADAPVRFLVAGMGDALSTVFEARANAQSDSTNYVDAKNGGFRRTKLGTMVAEYCYDMLIENGEKALAAAKRHVITEALEDIIEVNVLMSGIGVENNGCSGSHSICEGISVLPEDAKTMHGEKVGFGVLCQLAVENAPQELMDEVLSFCATVGLPITLQDLYIESTPGNIEAIAKHSMKSYWDTEPFYVDEKTIAAAIQAVDEMGTEYRNRYGIEAAYTRR